MDETIEGSSPAWQAEVGTGRTVQVLDGTTEKHSGFKNKQPTVWQFLRKIENRLRQMNG